jgi:hypothetical protein
VCATATAIIDTDPLTFNQFSLPNAASGNNNGTGTGLVYSTSGGNILQFRSLLAQTYVSITTGTNEVNIGVVASDSNTASVLVARDASGNFSAGTITASLTGAASLNLLLTGGTLTGSLTLPVGSGVSPSLQVGANNVGLSNNSGSLQFSTAGQVAFLISATQILTIPGFTSVGLVHNDANGNLSTSLVVNADVLDATLTNSKFATLSSTNTPLYIVVRDASGNFSAGTITATLSGNGTGTWTGNVNGAASLNLLLTGGTLTGALLLPNGTFGIPALQIGGSNIGISNNSGTLQFSTSGTLQLSIDASGSVIISHLTTGVVHSGSSGILTSSQVVNGDIAVGTIGNDKLVVLSTAGLVLNSATTATSANTASAIVARDASGNFSAGVITASFTGTVTGHATLDLALTGGTMTGAIVFPLGTSALPSVAVGTTNVGLSEASGALQFSTAGTLQFLIDASGNLQVTTLGLGVLHSSNVGVLSSGPVTNSDLNTLTTPGLVNNSATTATSANTANAIVARDASGNFAAGTITAAFTGTLTGHATLDLALAGGTLTGVVLFPFGTASIPAIQVGASNVGMSNASGALQLSTNGSLAFSISSAGVVQILNLSTGVVHANVSGVLTSSQVVNSDLATLTTAGLVANSATTATSANTANAIVARDASGNFAAGTITAAFTGTLTGHATLDLSLTGGTLTGAVLFPTGTASLPSVAVGAANVGLSSNGGALQLSTNGTLAASIDPTGVVNISNLHAGVVHSSSGGNLTSSQVVNSDLATLTTAGLVSNSATTATSANTANTIVLRDASGNFSAGTITPTAVISSAPNFMNTFYNGTFTQALTSTPAFIFPSAGSFTQVFNPSSNWSFIATGTNAGRTTYNGTTSGYFNLRVEMSFELQKENGVFNFWIQSGASLATATTPTTQLRSVNTTAQVNPWFRNESFNAQAFLQNGFLLQLAGTYTGASAVTFENVNYQITPII